MYVLLVLYLCHYIGNAYAANATLELTSLVFGNSLRSINTGSYVRYILSLKHDNNSSFLYSLNLVDAKKILELPSISILITQWILDRLCPAVWMNYWIWNWKYLTYHFRHSLSFEGKIFEYKIKIPDWFFEAASMIVMHIHSQHGERWQQTQDKICV